MTKKINSKSEYWRLLKDKLKKYKDIEPAIKDQIEKKKKSKKRLTI
jgi:hypothetical protein